MSAPPGKPAGLPESLKDRIVRRMLERRLRAAGAPGSAEAEPADGAATPPPRRPAARPSDLVRFDRLPGYQQMQLQRAAAERFGIDSPYFREHEAVAGARATIGGREYANFSSYNYLDLCGHEEVARAAIEAVERYGTSASASRPVSGERPVHRELEAALAELHGTEDCVAFVSGHATNVTSIGHLFGERDLILHDALIHNSITQGARLSGARRLSFPHNDWEALDALLVRHRAGYERVLIAIEGIYSMDGDYPDLPRFIDVKQRHNAILLVDEAHSIGVLGARGGGLAEHFGVPGDQIDMHMGTLSKTLAGCGGYIAGERALVEYLKFSAPGFLYSVGMSPPVAAAARAALAVMLREPERGARLRANGARFLALARERGLDTGTSAGLSVVPVICGSSILAARLSNALYERGINVSPIIYPAVDERSARLRFFLSCAHREEQIEATVDAVAQTLSELQGKSRRDRTRSER